MLQWPCQAAVVLGALLATATPLAAQAHSQSHASHYGRHAIHSASLTEGARHYRYGHLIHSRYIRYAGISCVPFARSESGIALTGNAAGWWDEAEGRYARGQAPEQGSVLNFRANAAMHLGHVAVVRTVINARQIEIDQANWWGPGGGHGVISRNIAVVDVSPHNDWTAVRVALGHSGAFGSVYPTYGFIYGREDGAPAPAQTVLAEADGGATLNPAPRDLRARGRRIPLATVHPVSGQAEEVAEAPAVAGPISAGVPDRGLR